MSDTSPERMKRYRTALLDACVNAELIKDACDRLFLLKGPCFIEGNPSELILRVRIIGGAFSADQKGVLVEQVQSATRDFFESEHVPNQIPIVDFA